jgi:stalled ribosome rescue protein Dom34
MSTFHAVVWMDHQEAHVVMFDREHVEAQRIRSRSLHKHQGKASDTAAFYADVAAALTGTREVLLTGPGLARHAFRDWCTSFMGVHTSSVRALATTPAVHRLICFVTCTAFFISLFMSTT